MYDWIRLTEDNLATAFGPDASYLLLHHRKDLDELVRNWKRQGEIDVLFNQLKYVRNSHYVFDNNGAVRAAGNREHCEYYMSVLAAQRCGQVMVIRESLEQSSASVKRTEKEQ